MEPDVRQPLLPSDGEIATAPDFHSIALEDDCQKLSVDDILRDWVGEFGWAQLLHFTLASLAWTLEALQTLVMIFADKSPSWQCSSTPSSSSAATLFPVEAFQTNTSDFLSACTPSSSICSMDPTLWEWVDGKSQSTVSEWALVCGEDYKVGLVQSVFFIGALVGAGLFGNLSDSSLGRKGVLALVCGLNAILGLLTAFSPNYWVYLLLRAATGVSSGGVGLSSFVLATEPVGPSKRGSVGMSAFYFFSLGIMMLSGLAYLAPTWRYLYVITSAPSVLYCLLILPFLRESPRWYLVQGRNEDALNVLKSIAKRNGRTVPAGVRLAIEQEDTESSTEKVPSQNQPDGVSPDVSSERQQASATVLDVFKISATRMRMIIMVFVWLGVALVYYGISLNVSNLGTNLYLSVFLNAIAELPAFAITAILLGKLGRRYMLVFTMLLSGVCCLVGAFVSDSTGDLIHLSQDTSSLNNQGRYSEESSSRVRLACGVVAIFGLAGAYNLLYIYTAELFPTVVRNAALGLASQAAQIGAIVAPMIAVLGKVHPSFPFGIFAVASLLSGLLALKLPETLHRPMYETLEGLQREEGD